MCRALFVNTAARRWHPSHLRSENVGIDETKSAEPYKTHASSPEFHIRSTRSTRPTNHEGCYRSEGSDAVGGRSWSHQGKLNQKCCRRAGVTGYSSRRPDRK